MHISEGVLSPAILTGGAALTAIGVGIGLKSIDYEEIPYMGILTAGFFVASLIHLPIGPASVHLNLEWYAGTNSGMESISGHTGRPGASSTSFPVWRNHNARY